MSKVTLSRKQQKFVNEYLIDFNGTRAAKAAGYSEKSAYSMASENLRKPEIKAYLEQKVSESNELAFLERQRVLVELKKIAYPSLQDQFLTQNTTSDRLKALLLIGKAHGLFWEKPEIKEESKWERALNKAMEEMDQERQKSKIKEIEV